MSIKLARSPSGRIHIVGGIDPGSVAAAAPRPSVPRLAPRPPVALARRRAHHVGFGQRQIELSGLGGGVEIAGMAPGRYRFEMIGQGPAVPTTPGSTALLGGGTYIAPVAPMTGASVCASSTGLSWVWCRLLAFLSGLG
jgi:hypothetical protein